MKKELLLAAMAFTVFFTSCSSDDPSTKSTFSIEYKPLLNKTSTLSKEASDINMNGSFSFTDVMLGVSDIEFEKEYEVDNVEIEEEIEYEGSFQFDVLNGTSSPSILPIDLEAGVYHELEFEIDNVLDSGNSIEITGSYSDGVSEYAFEFASTMEEEIEIENEMGINLNINETVHFVLYLQLESLFYGVDFSNAMVDDDGIIRINSNSNSEIASLIENRLENIMEFEDDED